MQKFVLQNIKYPDIPNDSRKSLYGNHSDTFLDLFSYFNAFAAKKWFKYTKIKNLHIHLQFEGTANISILGYNGENDHCIIQSQISDTYDTEITDLNFDLLGIKFQELSKTFKFKSGCFYTLISPEEINHVQLGIAICTYKREQYLLGNLTTLQNELLENEKCTLHNNIQVYVADNGKSVNHVLSEQNIVRNPNIRIFENINAGGTAGFTRCLIECLKCEKQPTHILFMDDDATFDVESVERTFALLSTLKDEFKNTTIGGAMLKEENPCIQQECGAFWNNSFLTDISLLGQNLNLSTKTGLLESIKENNASYSAWFYCCIPLALVKANRLPIPFFLHFDDVEYGIRTSQKNVFLNGICVWHPTEGKYSPSMRFYDSRNSIIASILLNRNISLKDLLFKNIRSFIDCITLYKYVDWSMYYQACSYLLNEKSACIEKDPLQQHSAIIKNKHKIVQLDDIPCHKETLSEKQKEQQQQYVSIVNKKRIFDAIVLFLALFIPAYKKDICQMNSSPYLYAPSFKGRKNVYIYIGNQQCFLLRKSIKESLKATFQFIRLNLLTILKFNAAKKDFRKKFDYLTSLDFWAKYLQLDK